MTQTAQASLTTCRYKVTVAEDRMESSLSALHAAGVQEISYLVRHTNEPCDDPYPRRLAVTSPSTRPWRRVSNSTIRWFVTHTWIDFSFVCTEEVYDRMKDGGTF